MKVPRLLRKKLKVVVKYRYSSSIWLYRTEKTNRCKWLYYSSKKYQGMRFVWRAALGWIGWMLASIVIFQWMAVSSVDRLFMAAFVGFLVTITVTLPERPTVLQLGGILFLVAAGLAIYISLVVFRLQYLLSG